MTEMKEFIKLSIEDRKKFTFIPLGDRIYNGLGYMLGTGSPVWKEAKVHEFHDWALENGIKYDGLVYEFPDKSTFLMARLMFE